MTENLLFKLEEKMMTLLSEVEGSRKEIQRLMSENGALKNEIERNIYDNQKNAKKVEEILLLVESVSGVESIVSNVSSISMAKPVLVQGDKA